MEEKLTVFRAGTKDGPSFSFSGDHSAREKNAVVQQPRDVWMVTEPDLYYPLNLRDKNTVRLFKADISPSVFDELKVKKHFKFHGTCVAEGKSTKHLKKQLESLDWKEIKLETCHGGMSLMDFSTLVRALMVYMKDHYPTTPDEYNFQAELKAASHWYWYPKSNKIPGHEEGDRTTIKLPKLVSGPHKDKRIKIAALETCKKWVSDLKELKIQSSPQKRSQRSKEDEQSSPKEDEIKERIYDLEESIFDLKTYFDFKELEEDETEREKYSYKQYGNDDEGTTTEIKLTKNNPPNKVAKYALHLDGELLYEEETLLKRRSRKRVRHKRNSREEDVLRLRSRKIILRRWVIPKPKKLFK